MPILVSVPMPYYRIDAYAPDVHETDHLLVPVMISQETPNVLPNNFNELPADEKARIVARYRYGGIRCRHDINDQIPVSKETLDI
jgi:hypothetical protein